MKTTRRDILKKLSILGIIPGLGLPFSAAALNNEIETAIPVAAEDDRAFWANLLYKISYPVVHNLAEGTLRKNMPLEVPPVYYSKVEKVCYMEAVGRTLAGVAPWLALPDDDTREGAMRKQLRNDLMKGLPRCVDPNSPDYLNFRTEQQPIVDAAFIAHGFIRATKTLWEPLDALTKKRFVIEFQSLRNRKAAYNNWLLFSGIIECFLMQIGEQYDPARIDFALQKVDDERERNK